MDMAEIEAGQVGMRQGPPPCPNGFLYQIRAGDTLFAIAQRFGTTVTQILAANPGLDPNSLQVARLICIPRAGAPGGCPAGTSPYTIRSGDTFYSIAQRAGTTVEAIQRANPGVNPNALRVGQVICVPGAAPPGGPACPRGSAPYVIRSGDTFFALAQRFGVSVADLQAANPGVNPNALQIGQLVCIPTRVQTTSS
jgi:peptidoglycan endopeptidase LytF